MELKLPICCLLLCCCLFVSAAETQESDRDNLKPTKIFDFDLYAKRFNKHYDNLVERIARKKFFLARVFKAFISIVGYKYGKLDYYLGINNLSDRSRDELRRMLMRPPDEPKLEPGDEDEDEDLIADEEEIRQTLETIVKLEDHEGFREVAVELRSMGLLVSREKRDLSSLIARRNSVDIIKDLYPNLNEIDTSDFVVSEEEDSVEPQVEARQIGGTKSRSSKFIKKVIKKLAALFSSKKSSQKQTGESTGKPNGKRDVVWVDHRQSNCLGPAKHQGDCASCYIFSTLALFEWHHCMSTNKLISFSEQYILDCGAKHSDLGGCNGGLEERVAEFIRAHGLELSVHYPYSARDGRCPYEAQSSMGYLLMDQLIQLKRVGTKEMAKVLDETPILFGVHVPEDLYEYKGGVHPGDNVKPADGLHSMLLVGDGMEEGNQYWLFRNSFGPDWGEQGYLKINKRAPIWRGKGLALDIGSAKGDILKRNEHHNKPAIDNSVDHISQILRY